MEATVCEASKLELRGINWKTEIMSSRTNDYIQVIIGNEPIHQVQKFVYLGCENSKDGDIMK